ncbi:MAG TPA: LamG domain-containing protein, partial [Candidatus Dormibacteraeota bacterium]
MAVVTAVALALAVVPIPVRAASPSPSPTPSAAAPSPSAPASPVASPTASATAAPTAAPSATPAPSPAATPSPANTPAPSPGPSSPASPTPKPSSSPTPKPPGTTPKAPLQASATTYPNAVLADFPLVYYRLDETGCCNAADSSGNANTGTYAAAGVTYGAPGLLTGSADTAIATAGATAVSRDAAFLPSVGARTVEIWAKTTAGGGQALVSYGQTNANTQYFQLSIRGGSQLVFVGWGDDMVFGTPYPVNDGQPHHYALTYDGGTVVTFFLDGQQIGQGGLAAPLTTTTVGAQPLAIGNGSDGPFVGTLDEAAIYGAALSPAQINAHWR